MRRSVAAVALLVLVACSSTRSDSGLGNAKVDVIKPQIEIAQISSIPHAARHVTGGIPVHYSMRVANRSAEQITLKSVSLQSVGMGAYGMDSHNCQRYVTAEGHVQIDWATIEIP